MQGNVHFSTSARSFEWEHRRDANCLIGKLTKHSQGPQSAWVGCTLRPEPLDVPKVRSITYYRDFLNGRRTLDPTYPIKEASRKIQRRNSCGALQDLVSYNGNPERIGCRTRSVLRDGKIVSEQTSSQQNVLNQSGGRSLRGVQVYQPQEVSPRKSKRGNDADTRNFTSQITTLPGQRHREEYIQTKTVKQRPDNSSHITTLPGCLVPQTVLNYANPVNKFVRCTNTTQEAEETVGLQVTKLGPKKSVAPVKNGLPAYQSLGTEILDVRMHKGRLTRREHQQSLAEEDFHKGLRNRPETLTDAFAVTFKLF